jgi:uncharacterized protein (TIGR03083 family)
VTPPDAAAAEPTVALLDATWTSLLALCDELGDDELELPTACPGWSVKDVLSHLIGIELLLLGDPDALPDGSEPAPVVIARINDSAIPPRRLRSGREVVAELRAVTAARLASLRGATADDFDRPTWSPVGPVPMRELLRVRVFDSWVHEQDVRRAVGRPGHAHGPVVRLVLDWHRRSLGYIVARRAGAPDGAVVVFDVVGDEPDRAVVEVRGTRARVVDAHPAEPTVTVRLDAVTFDALLCGRIDAEAALAGGSVALSGDQALGRQVLDNLAYLF